MNTDNKAMTEQEAIDILKEEVEYNGYSGLILMALNTAITALQDRIPMVLTEDEIAMLPDGVAVFFEHVGYKGDLVVEMSDHAKELYEIYRTQEVEPAIRVWLGIRKPTAEQMAATPWTTGEERE